MTNEHSVIDAGPGDDDQVAVLILKPTGQRYTAQTHGVSCQHPEAEGQLFRFTVSAPIPHVGCFGEFIEAEVQDVREWLTAHLPFVEIDDTRLGDADYGEAWLPVRVGTHDGILITTNCD